MQLLKHSYCGLRGGPLSRDVKTLWLILRESRFLAWGNFESLFPSHKDGKTESSFDLMLASQWSSLSGDLEGVVNSELSSSRGASLSNPTKTSESGAHLKYCLFPNVPSHVPKPGFC